MTLRNRFYILLFIFSAISQVAAGQIFRFPAPDTLSGNFFGGSVAVDGDVAVIGSTGFDGCGLNSGAAFVYKKTPQDTWFLSATLQPSDCQENHFFGKTVAISESHILVTSFRSAFNQHVSNGAYVFEKREDQWVQTARFSDPDRGEFGTFGSAIALDKNRFIVTAAGVGSGRNTRGAGYVYEKDTEGHWSQTHRITNESRLFNGVFGTSCDLDGNRIAISSSSYTPGRPGMVSIFDFDDADQSWGLTESIKNVQAFFMPLDLDGNRLLIGESKAGKNQSGRARLFEFDGETWSEVAVLYPHIPYDSGAFGSLVSLNGDTALVVGFDEQLALSINVDRVVYVFEKTDAEWHQRSILDVGNPFFGTALSFSSSTALIGQAPENKPGAVYSVQFYRP